MTDPYEPRFGRILSAGGFTETFPPFPFEAPKLSALDIYLRSYPLFVTNPRAMSQIILPPDSGSDYPVVRTTVDTAGLSTARILRLLKLLQSADPRQRKRGSRLASDALR